MYAMGFAKMPLGFDKASIKTLKINECFFSRGPFQGVTPSSLISLEVASAKLYKHHHLNLYHSSKGLCQYLFEKAKECVSIRKYY